MVSRLGVRASQGLRSSGRRLKGQGPGMNSAGLALHEKEVALVRLLLLSAVIWHGVIGSSFSLVPSFGMGFKLRRL
eukprot:6471551-Amphidinium_carterae.3